MAQTLDPDLKAAISYLIDAVAEHTRASEAFLRGPQDGRGKPHLHNALVEAVERAVCQVCDTAREVAKTATQLGLK